MAKQLPYPQDRLNGYVQLSDGSGNLYVVDKKPSGNEIADALKYAGAFLQLAKRQQELV